MGLNKYKTFFFILSSLLALGIYSNSYRNRFVYDDRVIIVENRLINDWRNIRRLWSADYFRLAGEISYRPIVTLSYFVDYSLWGLNPGGYHLTNVALHGLNVALLSALALLITGSYLSATAAASIFATHPALSEAVNAIGFREDLLAAFFYMASILLFASALKSFGRSGERHEMSRSAWPLYIFSVISFAFALLSKEMAVTLPAVLLGFDRSLLKAGSGPKKSNGLKFHLPFAVLGLGYLFFRLALLKNPQESNIDLPGVTLLGTVLSWPELFSRYLKLIFLPLRLSVDHPFEFSGGRPIWREVSFGAGLVVSLALVGLCRLKSREYFVMGLWFFIGMIPVANLYPLSNPVAERYLYLPFAGLAMMAGYTICLGADSFYRRRQYFLRNLTVFALLPGLIIFYSGLTYSRNWAWRDGFSLWTDTVEKSPGSYRAWSNLGVDLKRLGMVDKAAASYLRALNIRPGLHEVRYNLGNTFYERQMRARAALEYSMAIASNRDYHRAHFSLGVVLYGAGSYGGAARHFEAALRANPEHRQAALWLGASYAIRRSFDRALSQFYYIARAGMPDETVYLNIGSTMKDMGYTDRAALNYKMASSLNPGFALPYYGLGQTLEQKGYEDRAVLAYSEALGIEPGNAEIRDSLWAAIPKRRSDHPRD